MTRFARGGPANKKKAHEATSWSNMAGGVKKKRRDGAVTEKAVMHVKPNDSAGGSFSKFPLKGGARRKQGSQSQQWKSHHSHGIDSSLPSYNASTEPNDTDIIIRPCDDEAKPLGLAAELEQLKQTSSLTEQDQREIAEIIKKDKQREHRRMKRVQQRQSGKVCFNCREIGHDMADCPKQSKSGDQGTGICFKCGSTEHTVARCRVKLPAGHYPYATCFICKEQGHLSKQCPDNAKGLYPMGGCCRLCGSVEHYKKDCPELHKQQGIKEITLSTWKGSFSVDEEMSLHDKPQTSAKKKTPKVVKF